MSRTQAVGYISSIQTLDTKIRWKLRREALGGDAFDDTLEEKPKSQAALDTLWKDGKGSLTRVQFEAGDWLRRLCVGDDRPRNHVKVIVDNGRGGPRIDRGIDKDYEIEAAMHAVSLDAALIEPRKTLEWVCQYEYALADIARRMKTDRIGKDHVHHETAKRRIADVLETLADYKYGVDADRLAWRQRAGA